MSDFSQLSTVRQNMLTRLGYTPYCECFGPIRRATFNGKQMECKACGFESTFAPEFIERYKTAQAELRQANTARGVK